MPVGFNTYSSNQLLEQLKLEKTMTLRKKVIKSRVAVLLRIIKLEMSHKILNPYTTNFTGKTTRRKNLLFK